MTSAVYGEPRCGAGGWCRVVYRGCTGGWAGVPLHLHLHLPLLLPRPSWPRPSWPLLAAPGRSWLAAPGAAPGADPGAAWPRSRSDPAQNRFRVFPDRCGPASGHQFCSPGRQFASWHLELGFGPVNSLSFLGIRGLATLDSVCGKTRRQFAVEPWFGPRP